MSTTQTMIPLQEMTHRRSVAACMFLTFAMTAQAIADSAGIAEIDPIGNSSPERDDPGLSSLLPPSYLWDGGALPFVWGALVGRLMLDRFANERSEPLGFSSKEGGQLRSDWEVPGWAVTAAGGGVGLAMALGNDEARWFHVKGLAQSLSTASLLAGALKVGFSRNRPDYNGDPGAGFGGGNRSFPSGHSTQAFEIATYAALYLRQHGFDRFRPHGSFRWWEGVAYAGIYGGASLVAAERVLHHRHHVTDVLVGAALGTATSALFYFYQEHRYRQSRSRERQTFLLAPSIDGGSVGVQLQATY